MKKKFNELWKVKEGSKTIWKLQAQNGILSFNTKKSALKWQEIIKKGERKNEN